MVTLGEIEQRIRDLQTIAGSGPMDHSARDQIMDDIKAVVETTRVRARSEGYDDGYAAGIEDDY